MGEEQGDISGVSLTIRKLMGGAGERRYLWGLSDSQEAGWERERRYVWGLSECQEAMGGGGARRYLWGLTNYQEAGWDRREETSLGSL